MSKYGVKRTRYEVKQVCEYFGPGNNLYVEDYVGQPCERVMWGLYENRYDPESGLVLEWWLNDFETGAAANAAKALLEEKEKT